MQYAVLKHDLEPMQLRDLKHELPGDLKLLMTSQFPRKVSLDFCQIRGSKIREREEGK